MTIPTNPELNYVHTNEVTGVSYLWNGERWIIIRETGPEYVLQDVFDADQTRQDSELAAESEARIAQDEIHEAEINTLEFKLDQLMGLTFKGVYEFKIESDCQALFEQCVFDCGQDYTCITNCTRVQAECNADKVRPGYFEAVDPDNNFDHLAVIIISKADKEGIEVDWAGVLDKDDYLEVDHMVEGQPDKTNYGLYRIREEPELGTNSNGEEVYTLQLQFLQGEGLMYEGELYEIRGINAAEGINPEELGDFLTKEEAANTYLKLTGGTLTNSFKIQRGADKTHAQWKIQPNGGTDYATNIYNLEGPMRFRTSHTGNEGDAKNSHIILDPDVANGGANPITKIWKLATPTADDMAANKGYVDTQIAANSSTYDLPTATTSVKGGVKAAQTSGTYVGCTIMSGQHIGVQESTNTTKGVNFKGQACVTNSSTPTASSYVQGQLVFSTGSNSLFIKT